MSDKDAFVLRTPHFTLEGRSRAGHETYFRIREMGVALDIGRCPDVVVPMDHVFITHAHLDHAAGIGFYAAQRKLQHLDVGTIYVPEESAELVRELMSVQRRLSGSELRLNVVGMRIGEEVPCGRSLRVRASCRKCGITCAKTLPG